MKLQWPFPIWENYATQPESLTAHAVVINGHLMAWARQYAKAIESTPFFQHLSLLWRIWAKSELIRVRYAHFACLQRHLSKIGSQAHDGLQHMQVSLNLQDNPYWHENLATVQVQCIEKIMSVHLINCQWQTRGQMTRLRWWVCLPPCFIPMSFVIVFTARLELQHAYMHVYIQSSPWPLTDSVCCDLGKQHSNGAMALVLVFPLIMTGIIVSRYALPLNMIWNKWWRVMFIDQSHLWIVVHSADSNASVVSYVRSLLAGLSCMKQSCCPHDCSNIFSVELSCRKCAKISEETGRAGILEPPANPFLRESDRPKQRVRQWSFWSWEAFIYSAVKGRSNLESFIIGTGTSPTLLYCFSLASFHSCVCLVALIYLPASLYHMQ